MRSATDQATQGRLIGRSQIEDLVVVPLFALGAALILGAVIMAATGVDLATIGQSYVALVRGSIGSTNAVSETLTAAAPLVLAGLGLALGFRAGLFNIGAEGQVIMGGLAAVVAGVALGDYPIVIALPGAILAGALTGAFYASIAGWLRAVTGAHEVISTIMLNLISYRLLDYLLRTPLIQKEGRADPISKSVPDAAELPRLLTFFEQLEADIRGIREEGVAIYDDDEISEPLPLNVPRPRPR